MGTKILIAGAALLELTYRIDGFPLHYDPVRYPTFSIDSSVSGVGYNVARALAVLGDDVTLAALVGPDPAGHLVRQALARDGLRGDFVLESLRQTPHSLILYDREGRRQIHVDLKDMQDHHYPEARFEQALDGCAVVVMCNVNFCRAMLEKVRSSGRLIATDVHALSQWDDAYNQDFMRAAHVLFLSHERLSEPPESFIQRVRERYRNEVIVVGMGARGALLALSEGEPLHVPAVTGLPVLNTVGAGDALFSCFLHYYSRDRNAPEALRKAVAFAAIKIGSASGATGFVSEAELERRLREELGR